VSVKRFVPVRLKHMYFERMIRPQIERYNTQRTEAIRVRDESRVPHWRRSERSGAKTPIRIGVAGAGKYAQHHLKALTAYEGAEVAALLTTGGPAAAETAAAFGIPARFTDPEEFLAVDVDCYAVVVPPAAMVDVASRCLATGRPVLLEKPPGLTVADTEELIRVADAAGTWGMVGLNRRFYSIVEHGLAAIAETGLIRGAVVEIPQRIGSKRRSEQLTAFDYDNFYVRNSIHGVDLIRCVLGDPRRVYSRTWPNQERDNQGAAYTALLEYDKGVFGAVMDLWDTPDRTRLLVISESGRLELELSQPHRGWIDSSKGRYAIPIDRVDDEFRAGVWAQDLCFVEAVRAGRLPRVPAATLQNSLGTMRLVEQILADSLAA